MTLPGPGSASMLNTMSPRPEARAAWNPSNSSWMTSVRRFPRASSQAYSAVTEWSSPRPVC